MLHLNTKAFNELPLLVRLFVILALLSLIVFIMIWAKSFFVSFAVAGLLSLLFHPLIARLERWGLSRTLSIIITLVLGFVAVAALLFFFTNQIISFTDDLPGIEQRLNDKLNILQSWIKYWTSINEKQQISLLQARFTEWIKSLSGNVMGLFTATGSFLATLLLIPIYIFFLTYYRNRLRKFILLITPDKDHVYVENIMVRLSKITQRYLRGLLIDIAILSVLNSIGFYLLGIEHAILLGVMAAILNLIPYVGVMIGSILPVLIALLTKDSIWYAAGALGVCVVVQFIDNNFITPKVVGASVNLNPLATIIALIFGGIIWGLAGMMLFVPLLGMLKVVFDNIEPLKPFGYLMGDDERMPG